MYNLRVPGEQELNEGLWEVKRGEGCRSVDRLAPACPYDQGEEKFNCLLVRVNNNKSNSPLLHAKQTRR